MQVEAKAASDARNYAESRKLSYENAFLDTASRGYSDTVRAFVHHLGVSVGTVFNADSGRSALHNAAWKGNAAMVRLLVTELGGSVAVRCVRGRTPLLWAAFDGHAAVVRLLVTELGADASDRQPDGWTALHLAVANGHNEVIDLLVREFGVDVDERSTVASPFVSVTDSVNPSLALARLLAEHANGTRGPNGRVLTKATPLHLAAAHGRVPAARLLLELGADVEARCSIGRTPLHWAAFKGEAKVAQQLIEENADLPYGRIFNPAGI